MSLPQRGCTKLEMYAYRGRSDGGRGIGNSYNVDECETEDGSEKDEGEKLVEVFEGHSDVVKEFVWRRGGHGHGMFSTFKSTG